ncbi:MAG: type II CRISPR-associated endonuclease Cas1 [Actinobacteria bacterium]|nr:type II CRISPR-associated endonuclease Cas1 [Actinomycetota bacterium]
MTGPWQVVDLTGVDDKVYAAKGQLLVPDKGSVALTDILVILTGIRCVLHPSVFDRAAAYGIPLLHCDWRGVPIAATYTWSDHTRVGARQRAQAELSVPRQKNAWMRLVQAKIRGQAFVLQSLGISGFKELAAFAEQVRSGDPSNVEGRASRWYWTRLFGNREFRRVHGTRSGMNGQLDYGYTILRGACLRAVVGAGLIPSLGIWHRRRDNPFGLVDDIIEPFRPAVDTVVVKEERYEKDLVPEVKRHLAAVLDEPIAPGDVTVGTAIDRFAQQLGRYVEGDIRILSPPIFRGMRAA